MNRPIEFRAWHKGQGCMYHTQSSIGTEGDGWIDAIDFAGGRISLGCQADEGDYVDWFPLEEVKLMQFTGLHDKHGKAIYEGDILKGTDFAGEARIWEAARLNYFHHWQETQDLIEENDDIEVIGDIYSNPELLQS